MVRTLSRLYNIIYIYTYYMHIFANQANCVCISTYTYLPILAIPVAVLYMYINLSMYIYVYVCYIHVLISLASWNISTRKLSEISTHDIIYIYCVCTCRCITYNHYLAESGKITMLTLDVISHHWHDVQIAGEQLVDI